MSPEKLFSRPTHVFTLIAGLGGAFMLPMMTPQQQENTKGIMQLGRAYERRYEMQVRVARHNSYRNAVKLASGSRQALKASYLPRLTV